jgi:hypothetical protein
MLYRPKYAGTIFASIFLFTSNSVHIRKTPASPQGGMEKSKEAFEVVRAAF